MCQLVCVCVCMLGMSASACFSRNLCLSVRVFACHLCQPAQHRVSTKQLRVTDILGYSGAWRPPGLFACMVWTDICALRSVHVACMWIYAGRHRPSLAVHVDVCYMHCWWHAPTSVSGRLRGFPLHASQTLVDTTPGTVGTCPVCRRCKGCRREAGASSIACINLSGLHCPTPHGAHTRRMSAARPINGCLNEQRRRDVALEGLRKSGRRPTQFP